MEKMSRKNYESVSITGYDEKKSLWSSFAAKSGGARVLPSAARHVLYVSELTNKSMSHRVD